MTEQQPDSARGRSSAPTGQWSAVALVARREIVTRARSKAYRITTIATVVILVALTLVLKFTSGGGGSTVGYTDANEAAAQALVASGKTLGHDITVVRESDEATGTDAVKDGSIDAMLVGSPDDLRVVVKKEAGDDLGTTLDVLAGRLALNEQISELGGDPADVNNAIASADIPVDPLEPPYPYQTQQLVLGMIAGILIYLSLLFTGQAVAQGVVEEKSSRVVEILLSTIRPWQLMAGKVAGIGVIGLAQMVIIGVVGVAVGIAADVLTISLSAAVGTVVWLIVWYLLGFLMYALVFAALAALVSRQEDVGAVVTPVTMVVVIGYVVGISVLPSQPDSQFAEILSIIPLFAPTLMPMRLAMGGVPVWEAALSVALAVALIPLLVWFAGRVYRNAVMRTGSRVKLREALRQA
jgi:ABC-2 type transport system permease protein